MPVKKYKPTKAIMARNVVYALYNKDYRKYPMTAVMKRKYNQLMRLPYNELYDSNEVAIKILSKRYA